MKILVFFKTVPIFERVLENDWATFSWHSDLSYAGKQINCFDESALEIGLRLKEEYKAQGVDAECFAATAGELHPSFAQTLFAAGYDGLAQIEAKQGQYEFAPEATAAALASFAKDGVYDVILTGSVAGLADTGTVPLILADTLRLPILTGVSEVHVRGGTVDALCQEADGTWLRSGKTPVVVSIGNSPAVLRAVPLRARLAAKNQQPVRAFVDFALSFRAETFFFSRPDEKRSCRFLAEESVSSLAENLLRQELDADAPEGRARQAGFCPRSAVAYDIRHMNWYAPDEAAAALIVDWRARRPDYALLPDTPFGRMLAYRLAKAAGAFFMISASFSDDGTALCRRACASNVVVSVKPRIPAVLTMQSMPKSAQKIVLTSAVSGFPAWLLHDELRAPAANTGLHHKKLVIVCGAGMGKREHCELARTLAQKLSAGFGLTRMAAQSGWGEPREIIGQSGAALDCAVCLVLGASGASAFAVGLEGVSRVIAVNSDRNASIFKHADIGVVADAPYVVRALLETEASRCG